MAPSLLDYEGELALVIGRRCRHVPRARAAEVIAGYCIVNDVGIAMKPPTMLQVGDVVRIEIDPLGVIENPVVAEPDETVRIE